MTKLFIGVAAAALLAATSALAQTSTPNAAAATVPAVCTGLRNPAVPSLPDGANATNRQVREANEAYQAWGQERLTKLEACRVQRDAMLAQVRAMEDAYNAANQELTSVTASWQAEVEEYNGRSGDGNRRERGGVITRPDASPRTGGN